METVLTYLRQILGETDFYKIMGSSNNYTWDYGAMIEYVVAALLLLIVVSNIFRFIRLLAK